MELFWNILSDQRPLQCYWTVTNAEVPPTELLKKRHPHKHWKLRVVMVPNLSSLVTPEVVIMTTSGVTNGDKVGITKTVGVQQIPIISQKVKYHRYFVSVHRCHKTVVVYKFWPCVVFKIWFLMIFIPCKSFDICFHSTKLNQKTFFVYISIRIVAKLFDICSHSTQQN